MNTDKSLNNIEKSTKKEISTNELKKPKSTNTIIKNTEHYIDVF